MVGCMTLSMNKITSHLAAVTKTPLGSGLCLTQSLAPVPGTNVSEMLTGFGDNRCPAVVIVIVVVIVVVVVIVIVLVVVVVIASSSSHRCRRRRHRCRHRNCPRRRHRHRIVVVVGTTQNA